MKLILICGTAGSGKSTLTKKLLSNIKVRKGEEIALAKPLKELTYRLIDVFDAFPTMPTLSSDEDSEQKAKKTIELSARMNERESPLNYTCGDDDPKIKLRYRQYYQLIGTECCRKVFGNDFWCDRANEYIQKKDIPTLTGMLDYIIISDIRFQNEYEYFIDRYDTITIMCKPISQEIVKGDPKHASESEQTKITPDLIYDWTNYKEIETKVLIFLLQV